MMNLNLKIIRQRIAVSALYAISAAAVFGCTVYPSGALHAGPAVPKLNRGAAVNPAPAGTDTGAHNSIVGLWFTTYYDNAGNVVDQAYETFHADGTELQIDTAAPATDNVCSGVWTMNGASVYHLKHPSFYFDAEGNLQGTAVIRLTVTADSKNNAFAGASSVQVFDLSGTLIYQAAWPVVGTRISAE